MKHCRIKLFEGNTENIQAGINDFIARGEKFSTNHNCNFEVHDIQIAGCGKEAVAVLRYNLECESDCEGFSCSISEAFGDKPWTQF